MSLGLWPTIMWRLCMELIHASPASPQRLRDVISPRAWRTSGFKLIWLIACPRILIPMDVFQTFSSPASLLPCKFVVLFFFFHVALSADHRFGWRPQSVQGILKQLQLRKSCSVAGWVHSSQRRVVKMRDKEAVWCGSGRPAARLPLIFRRCPAP